MFWRIITKILVDCFVDLLVGIIVELVLATGSALYANYRKSSQVSFA
ncbi:MAG: hypothetical protein JOZ18_06740 [Chloroflexi bacterium]|nr:hypothetical protein [Chloroflexota bacterium]